MNTAFVAIELAIIVTCVALWAFRFFKRREVGTLLLEREQQVSPLGIVDIMVLFFIWFLSQTVGFGLVMYSLGLSLDDLQKIESLSPDVMMEFGGWMMLLQIVATSVSASFFLMRHRRVGWLGSRKSIANDVLVGVVAALMLIPLVMTIQFFVTQLIPYEHPTLDSMKENFTFKTAMWSWIAAVFGAPLVEEFFFRGVVQGFLQRVFDHNEPMDRWYIGGALAPNSARESSTESAATKLARFWIPIVITSGAFAAVHIGQGPAPSPLVVLSLGIGYIFRKTGSVWPCVIVHFLLNSISLTVLTLGIMYPELMPPEAEPAPGFFNFW